MNVTSVSTTAETARASRLYDSLVLQRACTMPLEKRYGEVLGTERITERQGEKEMSSYRYKAKGKEKDVDECKESDVLP
jgi:hypothetical protein